MYTAGRVQVPVVPDMRGLQKTIGKQGIGAGNQFSRGFSRTTEKQTSRAAKSIGTGLKRTIQGAGVGAALVAGFTIKKGLSRVMGIEDARAKLKGLGNDAKTVNRIMDSALKSVQGTAFSLDKAATTAAGAVAAGIKPGQELTKYLKQVADAATIAGTGMDEMGSVINKVTTAGKAQADNLNQLADRGIPIFQWLSKEYGVSATELSSMVRKGEVDSKTFNKVIRKNIGGAALASGDTTRGAMANMGASLGRIGAGLLSGFFPDVKSAFQGATKAMTPLEDKAAAVGLTIADFSRNAVRKLKSVKKSLSGFTLDTDKFDGTKFGQMLADGIGSGLKRLGGLAKTIATKIGELSKKVDWIGLGIELGKAAVPLVLGLALGILNFDILGVLKGLGDHWKEALIGVLTIAFAPAKLIGPLAKLLGRIPLAGRFLAWMVTGLNKAGQGVLRFIGSLFKNLWAGFRFQMGWMGPGLIARFTGMLRGILPSLKAWGLTLGARMGDAAKFAFFQFGRFVARGVLSVRTRFFGFIRGIIDMHRGAGLWLVDAGRNILRGLIRGVNGMFKPLRGALGGIKSTFATAVAGIGAVWAGLQSVFAKPVNWIIDNVINKLIGAVNAISKKLGGGKILDPFGHVGGGGGKKDAPGGAAARKKNIRMAAGGVLPGYTPGRDVHHFSSPTGGNLHLSGGEGILIPQATRMLGGKRGIAAVNDAARRGLAFAKGGVFAPAPGSFKAFPSYPGHTGVDLANPTGTPIRAVLAGVVSAVKHLTTSYGNHVVLSHGGGMQTLYAHMSKTLAKVGQAVTAGQVIGRVGSTGNSTGPHLHFTQMMGGRVVNPTGLLSGAVPSLAGGGGIGFDPVGWIKGKIAGITKKAKGVGGGAFGQALGGIPGKLAGTLIDWARTQGSAVGAGLSTQPGALGLAGKILGKLSGGTSAKKMTREAMKGYGWGDNQWGPLNQLVNKESGWNPNAKNPTSSARGLFQKMESIHGPAGDVKQQIAWGLKYIKGRYGSPAAAWAHSQRSGWYRRGGVYEGTYDRGGRVKPGTTVVHNKSGKDEMILTHREWNLVRSMVRAVARAKPTGLAGVNSRLKGAVSPTTLTKKAVKIKANLDRLDRKLDKAKTKTAKKKIRAEIADQRKALSATRRERTRVRTLIAKRTKLELRAARSLPKGMTKSATAALKASFTKLTLGGGSAITSSFLTGQLGQAAATPEALRAAYLSAQSGAGKAANATIAARRNAAIAAAKAKPVQQRIAGIGGQLKARKSDTALRASFAKESAAIKKLANARGDADTAKGKKKIQAQIDAARRRQAAVAKEYKQNRNLANERKKLQADGRLKALTKAQAAYNAKVAAEKVARDKATKAAEAYKVAQEAAVERAKGIRDAGMGLGSIGSAGSKTSSGIVSNLRKAVLTTRSWSGIVKSLIGAGLRGPILDEFIDAGPSADAVRTGKSLLAGGQIATIAKLQDELKKEATSAGSIGAANLPKSTLKTPGTWNASTLSYMTPGKVDMTAGANGGATFAPTVAYSGMPYDTVESIAKKTAERLARMTSEAGF